MELFIHCAHNSNQHYKLVSRDVLARNVSVISGTQAIQVIKPIPQFPFSKLIVRSLHHPLIPPLHNDFSANHRSLPNHVSNLTSPIVGLLYEHISLILSLTSFIYSCVFRLITLHFLLCVTIGLS